MSYTMGAQSAGQVFKSTYETQFQKMINNGVDPEVYTPAPDGRRGKTVLFSVYALPDDFDIYGQLGVTNPESIPAMESYVTHREGPTDEMQAVDRSLNTLSQAQLESSILSKCQPISKQKRFTEDQRNITPTRGSCFLKEQSKCGCEFAIGVGGCGPGGASLEGTFTIESENRSLGDTEFKYSAITSLPVLITLPEPSYSAGPDNCAI